MNEELQNYKGKAGKGVKKCEPLLTGDLTATTDLILNSIEINGGHMRGYPNTTAGLEMFRANCIDFFRYVAELNANPDIERKLIPDIEAMCTYIGIARATLFTYEKRGTEWKSTIQYFKNVIATAKKQLALNHKIPPVVWIFDAKNNHGYNDIGEQEQNEATDRIEEELTQAGLAWDEATGEFVPIGGNDD